MKVLVGSKNPVKVDSVKEAFSHYFDDLDVEGVSIHSDVPDQPLNDETFQGARNRAENLKKEHEADFYVGIEGGLIQLNQIWYSFGAICIIDKEGLIGYGQSPHFNLPKKVVERIIKREELGNIMQEIGAEENTKQKGGAISFFTKNKILRKDLYVSGVIASLIPFINKEMFKD